MDRLLIRSLKKKKKFDFFYQKKFDKKHINIWKEEGVLDVYGMKWGYQLEI